MEEPKQVVPNKRPEGLVEGRAKTDGTGLECISMAKSAAAISSKEKGADNGKPCTVRSGYRSGREKLQEVSRVVPSRFK